MCASNGFQSKLTFCRWNSPHALARRCALPSVDHADVVGPWISDALVGRLTPSQRFDCGTNAGRSPFSVKHDSCSPQLLRNFLFCAQIA